ncbi:MAG: AMP-binding protein [Synergistaceae bacterium]|nr:AMP-binding protein [Synergistaceae bacterium]
MIRFLENLADTVRQFPDRPAVVDRKGTRTTTYSELYSCALKVNRWLRLHGLGRDDVVAIYYPKGLEYLATRIGIMMSGAVWLGLEDIMGRDRIDFAIHDSGCKVVFDMEKWNEAMNLQECNEIADSDPHDLAFILYTSGSTGFPKGVLQEYGVYEEITKSMIAMFSSYRNPEPFIFAEVTPQSFSLGVVFMVGILGLRGTLHEIPNETTRDIDALVDYFDRNDLHYGFFTPNLLLIIKDNPKFKFKAVFVGGDSSSNLFSEKFDFINSYGFSESGHVVLIVHVDKPYETTPSGYNVCNDDIILLDEKGTPSDEGVICMDLPYFRGYMNDNKKSCFIEINGKKYFRGSDYVKRDKTGLYTVIGRIDDVIKINGNRVSLKGLAAAIKRILNLDFCYVNVFIKNGVKLLIAYYMSDKELDIDMANSTLRQHLPNYETVAWYIRIDHIPLNANGKVDYLAFRKPDMSIRTCLYVEPLNHVQKTLCEAIKTVLKINDSVGINDDFFMLGGDSLKAIEIVSFCKIPGLSVQMIYDGRTVKNISDLLEQTVKTEHKESSNILAPLNLLQLDMMEDIKKYSGIPVLTVPSIINIQQDVDLEKLSQAIRHVLKAHPILLSVVTERNGEYFFEQREEFYREIPVEEMTNEELEAQVSEFAKPFTFDGEPLFRCRIIKTQNKKVVLLDICHVVCDGFSRSQLISDIAAVLKKGGAWNGIKLLKFCKRKQNTENLIHSMLTLNILTKSLKEKIGVLFQNRIILLMKTRRLCITKNFNF